MVSERTDVVVVGLGAMGSAVCAQLAVRGTSVIGIDRYHPPHPYGSTHGETRMTRLAVGEGPEYVPLVRRSHELWREIEAQTGTRLLTQPGGLIMARPGSWFFEETRELARRLEIEHEELSAVEIRKRFPMFAVDEETEGYYEPAAGFVRPEDAVLAQLELARRAGAVLRPGEHVLDWSVAEGEVSVITDRASYCGERLILCAGPWLPELFPEGRQVFAVHRQVQFWFPIRQGYDQLRNMPVFVWDFGGERGGFVHFDGFYGFPAVDGPAGGVKIATETYQTTTEPDGRQHPPTPEETSAMYRHCVERRVPWVGPDPVRTLSCLYTCTRGSRFVIDRHPEHDAVLIVSPCSGHGFKHSPAIGEAVAQWVTEGTPELDLGAFRLPHASHQES
ncbi:MAG: N-methyl-L-tryptophan oxidase, partial [Solirubrobacterales bacterium]|nr:N-methyl-L-tryptophan oxidase [Solirubrobacterales bacterium]